MKNSVISSYKARLCFDGRWVFEPAHLTHAQLASQASINMIFAIRAAWDCTITSGDVPAAYVQAELPEDNDTIYYMSQPQGFVHPEHPDWILRLNKALYGHPRAGQVWQNKFSKFLIDKVGCMRCKADLGVYVLVRDKDMYIIPTVVDNTADITTSESLRKYVHKKLKAKFGWKYDGEMQWFLGCHVIQDKFQTTVSQIDFLNALIEKFKGYTIPLSNTPMTSVLLPPEEGQTPTDFPYDSLVGSLLWLMHTQPEISFAVAQCAKFSSTHTERHDKAALKILGYLKKFPKYGIFFRKPKNPSPTHP